MPDEVFNPNLFAQDLLSGLYDARLHDALQGLTVEQLEQVAKALDEERYDRRST